MSQAPLDILRSLHYYVAQHLLAYDEDYDVRLASDEEDWEAPAAVITTAGGIELRNRGRRVASNVRPFAIYAYPARADTVRAAELEAERVEAVIAALFQIGGHRGRPQRIPLYDWSAVADNKGLPEDAAIVAWARVVDPSVDHKPDPQDGRIQVVIATFRLDWRAPAEPKLGGETLERVGITMKDPT